jgi:hypothetical protein
MKLLTFGLAVLLSLSLSAICVAEQYICKTGGLSWTQQYKPERTGWCYCGTALQSEIVACNFDHFYSGSCHVYGCSSSNCCETKTDTP